MTKNNIKDLAIFGNQPTFDKSFCVGQFNMPKWEKFEDVFNGIFSRRYYTNQGPLTEELESKLCEFLRVKNAVCVTNATLGLLMIVKALGLKGKVIIPSFSFISNAQSLLWAGVEPIFCDVDSNSYNISISTVEPNINGNVSAILGFHTWGNSCHSKDLQQLATQKGIKLYYDATHAFGSIHDGINFGNFGDLEVFSFNATEILSATEGGCVCTNDDLLAEKLRNIRSSYGTRKTVSVPLTANGRMSEAQAAMALLSLEDFEKNRQRNKIFYEMYINELNDIEGIKFFIPEESNRNNYQNIVFEISEKKFGISRDKLLQILASENIICQKVFYPGLHRTPPFSDMYHEYINALPTTDRLCDEVLQLPSGYNIDDNFIETICELIRLIHKHADIFSKDLG